MIAVSKPPFRAVTIGFRAAALPPPSTRQAATLVAPFQLTYTVILRPWRVVATAGGVAGVPFHGNR